MDNKITGIIAAIIFVAFVAGLAESISELPFTIIVAIVCIMVGVDVYQSISQGRSSDKPRGGD